MKTEIFKIGSFSVHGYGLMIGIGFIIALIVGEYRAKKKHMSDEAVIDIAILAGVLGFLGGKILYVIVSFKEFLSDPLAVLGSSGFVVYGGIIVGVLAGYIYCKIKKLKFLEYFDLIMPEIAIAQGFGRIGCFLAGCCYGRPTTAWYGVTFPTGCEAPAGISLVPTQLFSSFGDLLIAVILILIADLPRRSKQLQGITALRVGDIGALYLILYGIGRFVIEFFRNDYRGAVGFLSTSQFISIFIVIIGIALMVIFRRQQNTTRE
jgi:phosphatidylglycerol:prolipoprotein diacylglycerol transferase